MISTITLILSIIAFIIRLMNVIDSNKIENYVLGVPTDDEEIRNVLIELILWIFAIISLTIMSWKDIVKFFNT